MTGWDLVVEPIEDAFAADGGRGRFDVTVGAFGFGEPDRRRLGVRDLFGELVGLSGPELLIVRVGEQDRTGDLGEQVVGEPVVADSVEELRGRAADSRPSPTPNNHP